MVKILFLILSKNTIIVNFVTASFIPTFQLHDVYLTKYNNGFLTSVNIPQVNKVDQNKAKSHNTVTSV